MIMEASESPDDGLGERIRVFIEQGWRIEDIDGDRFVIFAPDGSAYPANGVFLCHADDDAPEWDELTPERQEEERAAATLCDLVVRFRFQAGTLFSTP